ncbi:MAG: lipopolysaccharide biosynthesis protein [Rikenellaceae bacterium]|nr:lipopolysaccharide biosynthesis protein [Rikenellaceae bacterium]
MEQNVNNIMVEEQEIDLVELIQKLWHNRWLIVKITIVFMVLGLLVALFSPKVYTASCDVVPQTSDNSKSSQMSSLAKLAGINLSQGEGTPTLSPYVYENILKSTKFKKELMQTEINFEKADRPVSFYEYYTSEEFNKPTVVDYVLKYTIGLPGVIMGAIRGEQPEPDYSSAEGGAKIESLTKDEYEVLSLLGESVMLSLDDKKGYVSITVNMPEPLAAAQLAQATLNLLQEYITVFKVEKVQSNLDFVQERYNEVKRDFEDVQARRARYRDANHNTIKNQARIEQERLEAEYQLAMNIYSELAMQLEQAKIKVKETTPILTVINPVTVPYKKSKPQRAMILMAFTFLGAVAGMGCVLVMPTVADIVGSERLKGIVKELPAKQE